MRKKLLRLLSFKKEIFATLILAFLLSGITRLGITVIPFKIMKELPARAIQHKDHMKERICKERIIWSVIIASRYIPGTTCLSRALTAQIMLSFAGQSSDLRIGVMKSNENRLRGHAWLECDGASVIGGSDIEQYEVLNSA